MDCSGDNIRMVNVEVVIKAFRLFWIATFCPRIPTKFGEQLRTTSCSSPSQLSSKIKLCSKTFTQIPRPGSLCLTELNLSINYPAKGKIKQTNMQCFNFGLQFWLRSSQIFWHFRQKRERKNKTRWHFEPGKKKKCSFQVALKYSPTPLKYCQLNLYPACLPPYRFHITVEWKFLNPNMADIPLHFV